MTDPAATQDVALMLTLEDGQTKEFHVMQEGTEPAGHLVRIVSIDQGYALYIKQVEGGKEGWRWLDISPDLTHITNVFDRVCSGQSRLIFPA